MHGVASILAVNFDLPSLLLTEKPALVRRRAGFFIWEWFAVIATPSALRRGPTREPVAVAVNVDQYLPTASDDSAVLRQAVSCNAIPARVLAVFSLEDVGADRARGLARVRIDGRENVNGDDPTG